MNEALGATQASQRISCDCCGETCEGTWECNGCSATLCEQCATEYEDGCGICYQDEDDE